MTISIKYGSYQELVNFCDIDVDYDSEYNDSFILSVGQDWDHNTKIEINNETARFSVHYYGRSAVFTIQREPATYSIDVDTCDQRYWEAGRVVHFLAWFMVEYMLDRSGLFIRGGSWSCVDDIDLSEFSVAPDTDPWWFDPAVEHNV